MNLNGVTIVDTRTGELMPNMTVVIEGDKITTILPAAPSSAPSSPDSIDAHGKFLVPGFCDMHAHVIDHEHPEDPLAVMLAHGITAFRQMSGSVKLLEQRRQGSLNLGTDAPELLAMPGDLLLRGNAPNPQAAVDEIQTQKQAGADFIKAIDMDPDTYYAALDEAGRQGLPVAGHLATGVDAAVASQHGMRSIEHLGPSDVLLVSCSTQEAAIRAASQARPSAAQKLSPETMATFGKLAIANPILVRLMGDPHAASTYQQLVDTFSEDKCRKLAETFVVNNTWQCPTLIRVMTMQFGDDPRYTQDANLRYIPKAERGFWTTVAQQYTAKLTPAFRETLRKLAALHLKMTGIFNEAGVKMLAGTDFGGGWVTPGHSLHQEFDLLAEAGLSPLRILQLTTLDAAAFLDRQSTSGAIDSGKDANLVLLDANPIESHRNLHKIHGLLRSGVFYSIHSLETMKQTVAGRIAAA